MLVILGFRSISNTDIYIFLNAVSTQTEVKKSVIAAL